MYPYLETPQDWSYWTQWSGGIDPLDAVFLFTQSWNNYIKQYSASLQFTGVAVDIEELKVSKLPSVFNETLVQSLKVKYGMYDFGVALGFDETGKMQKMASYVDSFYLEFYDFYWPYSGIDMTMNSPWITNMNNSTAILNYMINEGLGGLSGSIINMYKRIPSQIYAMWSIQNRNNNCLYPLTSGSIVDMCGINYEFGAWSPSAFNDFVRLAYENHVFSMFNGQGIFQFNFLPPSWVKQTASNTTIMV